MKECDNCSAPIGSGETRCKDCLKGNPLSRYRDPLLVIAFGLATSGAWLGAHCCSERVWFDNPKLHFIAVLLGISSGLLIVQSGITYAWEVFLDSRKPECHSL